MAAASLNSLGSPWSLANETTTLSLNQLRATLNFAQPSDGLGMLQAGHESLPGNLLQIRFNPHSSVHSAASPNHHLPQACTESYLRGDDAVADYAPSDQFPFHSSVYWRALSNTDLPVVAALEVIVSTQTHLLDSHPKISVSTSLPGLELWRLTNLQQAEFKQVSLAKSEVQQVHYTHGPGCYLWRLSGARWSFAEMLPPSDFHSTDIDRDDAGLVRLTHRLFERSLEKGVILKARVRGVLLDRARDGVSAIEWYRNLLQSEPPLTT